MACLIGCMMACDQPDIGYLWTRDAAYIPDTLEVKAQLDPGNTEDARRIRFEIPWQGSPLEGIQGTMPLRYAIREVQEVGGTGIAGAAGQFSLSGKGIVELPFDHTVSPGRYLIHITVFNEGHSHDLDSLFTVIVR